jgi:acyl-ACP thioesterase
VAEPIQASPQGDDLAPSPVSGRTYTARRRVQAEEVTPAGRFRLDAMARYLANVATDDVAEAGLDGEVWLVRRTEVHVLSSPMLGEQVELVTYCSGTGPRWAERRTSLRGDRGGRVEAASLWVRVDPLTGAPVALTPSFLRCYGPAAGGRRVRARLTHADPPAALRGPEPELPPSTQAARPPWRPFPLRASDFDAYGHLNNAVAWEVVEDEVARLWDGACPEQAEVEYRRPVEPTPEIQVLSSAGLGTWDMWLIAGGEVRTSARLRHPTRPAG